MSRSSPIYIIVFLIIAFLFWANEFEIDEAVRAEGVIVPKGRVQIVQVADGGVLGELFVSEGEMVNRGQVLAKLEDIRAAAKKNELKAQLAALTVAKIRAQAEASGELPVFKKLSSDWLPVIKSQKKLFIEKKEQQDRLIGSLSSVLKVAEAEFALLSQLDQAGDASNLRMMQAEKDLIETKQALEDAQLSFRADALREVAEIDSELYILQFSLEERENIVQKTNIIAPKSGIVTNLRYSTLGATVASGEEFLSISPTNETLELEVKIKPVDVGGLRLDMPVNVKLSAFDSSIYGDIKGNLTLISADAISEQTPQGVATYFKGVAELDWETNKKIDLSLLRPGMTATIDIKTGSRTVLTYLLKPLLRGFSQVFTER